MYICYYTRKLKNSCDLLYCNGLEPEYSRDACTLICTGQFCENTINIKIGYMFQLNLVFYFTDHTRNRFIDQSRLEHIKHKIFVDRSVGMVTVFGSGLSKTT